MQVGVTEFKRRLREHKFADEPIHITKRGKYMGVYVSENAKATVLAAERLFRETLDQRGFTPEIMRQIRAEARSLA